MEPVPETERMEEFRSSPASIVPSVPALRIHNPNAFSNFDVDPLRKPPTLRRCTDPSPISPISPISSASPSWSSSTFIPYRPRTASPLSGTHSRSRSTNSLAPPMSRTQSLPGVNGAGHILPPQRRPASPSGSPSRVRTPRKLVDESFPPVSPVRSSVLEPERRQAERRSSSPILGISTSTPARMQRPSSPLRSVTHSGTGSLPTVILASTPSSMSSTSSYKSYDALSSSYGTTYSSVPSTPTSTRSRSPSISSLETIPDTPDAEEAAAEAERIAQLKADADAADGGDSSESKGRGSLELPTRGRTMTFGSREKRKRWSVCGAERRGDLDLETIWED